MKLTKENVYVDLKGRSKEELTELYNFLISVGEKPFRDKEWFLNYSNDDEKVGFSSVHFCGLGDLYKEKTKVTIQQLKEILQPTETLQEKEQRLLKELEEVRKEIEENKIKVGDVCKFWNDNKNSFVIGVVQHVCENTKLKYETIFDCQFPNAEKITNTELIKLLEQEIK
nr:hypothetical protein [uncultured Flavobacterium sp.]